MAPTKHTEKIHVREFLALMARLPRHAPGKHLMYFVAEAHETIRERSRYLIVALLAALLSASLVCVSLGFAESQALDVLLVVMATLSGIFSLCVVYIRATIFEPYVLLGESARDELDRLRGHA